MLVKVRKVNPKWEPARQLYERIISRPVFRLVSRVRRIAAGVRQRRTTCLVVAVCVAFAGLLVVGMLVGHWATGKIIWYCVAVVAAMLAIAAQVPQREDVSVELETLGSIAFTVREREPDARARCRIEADAALIPVQQAWPPDGVLAKLCVPSISGHSEHPAPECRIAVARREWLSGPSGPTPFQIERTGSTDGGELAVVMQIVGTEGTGSPLAWRQSDNEVPMEAIPHQEVAVDVSGRLEFHVTRGPIAILRTASVERDFLIQHEDLKASTYFRLDTMFGKTLWAPPSWHEDLTERCLRSGATESLRIWREFGSCGPSCQNHYKRKVQFGRAVIGRPTLVVLGDACAVTAAGRELYSIETPFVAVVTKYSHDPCFCTEGFPYMTLIGAERAPGRQPWIIALQRGDPPWKQVEARVTVSNSSGMVRAEGWGENLTLEDYQTVSVRATGPYLAVRPMNAKQYVLRATGDDVRLGNRRFARTYWTTWPEWSHWVFYGVLTLLWLPVLQWLTRLFWSI
jgi:hypothetical protein